MKTKAKYFVLTLGLISFLSVASGGVLALHLITQDQNHNGHGGHDSSTCGICQNLVIINKKTLVEEPLLLPELSPTEFYFTYPANIFFHQDSYFLVNSRAPPA